MAWSDCSALVQPQWRRHSPGKPSRTRPSGWHGDSGRWAATEDKAWLSVVLHEADGPAPNGLAGSYAAQQRPWKTDVEGGRRGCAVKLWDVSLNTVFATGVGLDKAAQPVRQAPARHWTGRPDQYLHRSNPKSWNGKRRHASDRTVVPHCRFHQSCDLHRRVVLVAVSLQDFRPNPAAVAPSRLSIICSELTMQQHD